MIFDTVIDRVRRNLEAAQARANEGALRALNAKGFTSAADVYGSS